MRQIGSGPTVKNRLMSQQDLSSERNAGLHGTRRMPQGTSCFCYSAPMPLADRDAARLALRDIRRLPQTGVCFSY